MPLYIILLALSLILLLLYIILYWRSYVKVDKQESDNLKQKSATSNQQHAAWPSFTVLIITHDSDRMLQYAIDRVAAQQYPDFEIMVVNNASTDNTNDVIKRCTKQYPNILRSTHLPQNRNGILHMAMATTLGVRAARKDWVVLLRPNSIPKSPLWLHCIADAINHGCDLCLGYNQYYGLYNAKWEQRASRWYRKRQLLNYRAINRGSRKPIEAESSNLAFRKQDFLDNGGYGRWLNLANYHQHLYASTYATHGTTTMLMQPEAQVETMLPPIFQLWQTDYQQTRKAYRRLSSTTKLRRSYYSRLTMLFLTAALVLIVGIVLAIWPLAGDTSATIINNSVTIPGLPSVPAITLCSAIVFAASALIHHICRIHCRRRDYKMLNTPIITNTAQIFESDEYDA